METTKKRSVKYNLARTRNSEFETYRSNLKTLFVRNHGQLEWRGQHEQAEVLESRARQVAAIYGISVEFELRTGTGILVEWGSVTRHAPAERLA